MSASGSSAGSRSSRRLVYIYRAEGGPAEAVTEAIRVAAAALLVSNSVRRCLHFQAYESSRRLLLEAWGSRVRGLAPQETAVRGVARSLLSRGRWPGIRLTPGAPPPPLGGCVGWRSLLAGAAGGCPGCVVVDEAAGTGGFKPRWLVAGLMVVYDAACGGCCAGPG